MTRSELESMTKDELVEYADDMGVEVDRHWLKDDIITEILKAEKAAAKQEAKQEQTQEQPIAPSGAKSAEPADVDPETGVSPEMAEIQRQANQPVDDSTRFASKDPPVVRKDD